MGDMADMALDDTISMECLRQDYRFGMVSEEQAYDIGIVDEHGHERTAYKKKVVAGAGPCPKCKGPTTLKKGKFGEFYGCCAFPKCRGSRAIR